MAKLNDLREWLLLQIDGSEETRGDDGLISGFIAEIDALPSGIAEPRGCPTPGACSAVDELADLKQRLLPQFAGRTQRAEHERDALLEELIVRRTTIANLHDVIHRMRKSAPSATAATDRPDWARQLPGAEIFDRAARVNHGYDRTASLNSGRYVCLCGGACSHYDAGGRQDG